MRSMGAQFSGRASIARQVAGVDAGHLQHVARSVGFTWNCVEGVDKWTFKVVPDVIDIHNLLEVNVVVR